MCLSGPRSGPSSPSRIFQLIVRIRKLVKNGAMTRNRMQVLVAAAAERDRVGDREADEEREQRREAAVDDRVEELLAELR